MCVCVRMCVHAQLWGPGVRMYHTTRNLWAFSPELGNTISSLFGGGATADSKDNGTETVQVGPGGSQCPCSMGVRNIAPHPLRQSPHWSLCVPVLCYKGPSHTQQSRVRGHHYTLILRLF